MACRKLWFCTICFFNLFHFSCVGDGKQSSVNLMYNVGIEMRILNLALQKDRPFLKVKYQEFDGIDFWKSDTLVASYAPLGLSYFCLDGMKVVRIKETYGMTQPNAFPQFNRVVCSSLDSGLNRVHIVQPIGEDSAIQTLLTQWEAHYTGPVPDNGPSICRVSDSICAFNDGRGVVHFLNVRTGAVFEAGSGFNGLRPLAYRTKQNELICGDFDREKLFLVEMKSQSLIELTVRSYSQPILYSEDDDAIIFLRHYTNTERMDLIQYSFTSGSENVLRRGHYHNSAILLSDSISNHFFPEDSQ